MEEILTGLRRLGRRRHQEAREYDCHNASLIMVEHWVLDEEAKDYHLKLDVIND
jgi:hypothetical protein